MASGWDLWVWLECTGVVSETYRYPHNNYYFSYSTSISSFFGSNIPTSLLIFKMFFRSYSCYFCAIYSKRCSKNIQDRSKIKFTQIIINYI